MSVAALAEEQVVVVLNRFDEHDPLHRRNRDWLSCGRLRCRDGHRGGRGTNRSVGVGVPSSKSHPRGAHSPPWRPTRVEATCHRRRPLHRPDARARFGGYDRAGHGPAVLHRKPSRIVDARVPQPSPWHWSSVAGAALLHATVVVLTAALLLVAVARWPRDSTDVWSYAAYGRMVSHYGASPYRHVPVEYSNDRDPAGQAHLAEHQLGLRTPVERDLGRRRIRDADPSAVDADLVPTLAALSVFLAVLLIARRTRARRRVDRLNPSSSTTS